MNHIAFFEPMKDVPIDQEQRLGILDPLLLNVGSLSEPAAVSCNRDLWRRHS
jgi:hypothetical protein